MFETVEAALLVPRQDFITPCRWIKWRKICQEPCVVSEILLETVRDGAPGPRSDSAALILPAADIARALRNPGDGGMLQVHGWGPAMGGPRRRAWVTPVGRRARIIAQGVAPAGSAGADPCVRP